jgi:hypothetical protein
MMLRLTIRILVAIATLSIAFPQASAEETPAMYQQVRMADLLSHAKNYDGKYIQILGVFSYASWGDNWLYPTRVAAAKQDRQQAIFLQLRWSKIISEKLVKPIDGHVVAIAGNFHFDGTASAAEGAMRLSEIVNITSIPCGPQIVVQNGLFGSSEQPCPTPAQSQQ